jgi:hypothetical protein
VATPAEQAQQGFSPPLQASTTRKKSVMRTRVDTLGECFPRQRAHANFIGRRLPAPTAIHTRRAAPHALAQHTRMRDIAFQLFVFLRERFRCATRLACFATHIQRDASIDARASAKVLR